MTDYEDLPMWAVLDRGPITGPNSTSKPKPAKRSGLRRLARALYRLAILAMAVGVGFAAARIIDGDLLTRISDTFASGEAEPDAGIEEGVSNANAVGFTTPSTSGDDAQATATLAPPELVQPSVELGVVAHRFTLTALVPDETVQAAIEMAVADMYGSYGTSDIVVDAGVASEPWLDDIPLVVRAFSQIVDGSILVGADGVLLTGRSASRSSADALADLLSVGAFAPLTDTLELVDLKPPVVEAVALEGVLTLSGVVPSTRVKDDLAEASMAVYGEDNVVDNLEIDDGTYARFDALLLLSDLALFEAGGDFTVGLHDDRFSAVLGDGISFEPAQAILTADSSELLDGLASAINRTEGDLSIVGYTDNVGSDDDNLALSQDRASAVADYLVSQQVDRSRITVKGEGENDPVASNDSDEGRDRNRRVVITIGDVLLDT